MMEELIFIKIPFEVSHYNQNLGFSIRGGAENNLGIYVSKVEKNSIGFVQGLRSGDQIIEVNGIKFTNITSDEALEYLTEEKDLCMIISRVLKSGELKPVAKSQWSDQVLVEMNSNFKNGSLENNSSNDYINKQKPQKIFLNNTRHKSLGFCIRGGSEYGTGIFVSKVDAGGVAESRGLRPGQQILDANGHNFCNINHQNAVNILKQHDSLILTVMNGRQVPANMSDELLSNRRQYWNDSGISSETQSMFITSPNGNGDRKNDVGERKKPDNQLSSFKATHQIKNNDQSGETNNFYNWHTDNNLSDLDSDNFPIPPPPEMFDNSHKGAETLPSQYAAIGGSSKKSRAPSPPRLGSGMSGNVPRDVYENMYNCDNKNRHTSSYHNHHHNNSYNNTNNNNNNRIVDPSSGIQEQMSFDQSFRKHIGGAVGSFGGGLKNKFFKNKREYDFLPVFTPSPVGSTNNKSNNTVSPKKSKEKSSKNRLTSSLSGSVMNLPTNSNSFDAYNSLDRKGRHGTLHRSNSFSMNEADRWSLASSVTSDASEAMLEILMKKLMKKKDRRSLREKIKNYLLHEHSHVEELALFAVSLLTNSHHVVIIKEIRNVIREEDRVIYDQIVGPSEQAAQQVLASAMTDTSKGKKQMKKPITKSSGKSGQSSSSPFKIHSRNASRSGSFVSSSFNDDYGGSNSSNRVANPLNTSLDYFTSYLDHDEPHNSNGTAVKPTYKSSINKFGSLDSLNQIKNRNNKVNMSPSKKKSVRIMDSVSFGHKRRPEIDESYFSYAN